MHILENSPEYIVHRGRLKNHIYFLPRCDLLRWWCFSFYWTLDPELDWFSTAPLPVWCCLHSASPGNLQSIFLGHWTFGRATTVWSVLLRGLYGVLFLHEDSVMHESHMLLFFFFILITSIRQPSWICTPEGACGSCLSSVYGYRRIPWYVSHSYKPVLIPPSSWAGRDGLHDALSHLRKPCSLIITTESLNNSVWNRPQRVCGVTSFLCQDNTGCSGLSPIRS